MVHANERYKLPKVVIAGGSGFVGEALAKTLYPDFYVIALSRVAAQFQNRPHTETWVDEWRSCDLFFLREAKAALLGADYAYYLVHSMMPATRLSQGDFWDFDLIAADNFARAASHADVRQIIYLGGLVPSGDKLSRHLKSRLEVENALGAYKTPVTALRAGMVIGPEGSSFLTMVRVVQNAPIFFFPKWADTVSHPIALEDVVKLLAFCVGNETTFGQSFDVGGPELMSYKRLVFAIGAALGTRKMSLAVPIGRTRLLSRILSILSGAPQELVAPLVESLKHPIVARERKLNLMAGVPGVNYKDAIFEAVRKITLIQKNQRTTPVAYQKSRIPKGVPTVRSVQRFPLPQGKDAEWAAQAYLTWLPSWMRYVLRVEKKNESYIISLNVGRCVPLLILTRHLDHSWPDRQLFLIDGGLLVREASGHRGRLEFREVLGGRAVLVAVHDFAPKLPWYFYLLTQARIHLSVMGSFKKYLERIAKADLDLNRFFGGKLKDSASLAEIEKMRTIIPRLPRVRIEPLHKISFKAQGSSADVQVANISVGGIGFIRSSVEEWPAAGASLDGVLTVGADVFQINTKVIHVSPGVVGVQFSNPDRSLVLKIHEHLLAELSGIDMIPVPSENLKEDRDGRPYWFHGTNNCELYFVEKAGKVIRFNLVYFGHYLEGGFNEGLRYGYVVDEECLEKPKHKGAALVRWETSLNAEILSTALRLIQSIRGLQPEHKENILSQIY